MKTNFSGLLKYLGTSFGWLLLMALWPLLIVPQTEPRCHTSTSFGFLPAAIVVPFLTLLLYPVSVAVHAVFAFRKRRFAEAVPLFGRDAAFFIPFTVLSVLGLMSVTNWATSVHCF